MREIAMFDDTRNRTEIVTIRPIRERLTAFMKRVLDPNTQLLVKAGFIDSSLSPTTEGMEYLYAILFEANKDAMLKAAQEKIDEEEKEDK